MYSLLLFVLLAVTFVVSFVKERNLYCPAIIYSLAFTLPAFVSSLGLSDYQTGWIFDTKIIIVGTILIWTAPILFIRRRSLEAKDVYSPIDLPFLMTPFWAAAHLLETYLLGGRYFDPSVDVHTAYVPVLSIITRSGGIFILFVLTMNVAVSHKSALNSVLAILVVCVYTSRFARLDVMVAILPAIVFTIDRLVQERAIFRLCALASATIGAIWFLGVIQQYRWSQAGTHQVDTSEYIKYNGPIDPLGIAPLIYQQFPMSVENFDYTLRNDETYGSHTYGIHTFDWLIRGLQIDNFFPELYVRAQVNKRFYHIGAATVATYLEPFLYDYGRNYMLGPLAVFVAFMYWLYFHRPRIYFLFIGPLSLLCFQAIALSAMFFYSVIFYTLAIWLQTRQLRLHAQAPNYISDRAISRKNLSRVSQQKRR